MAVNPLQDWNDAEAEKTPSEKAEAAASLQAKQEESLAAFRADWTVWVPGEDGEEGEVMSAEEARRRFGEAEMNAGLADPKKLLAQLQRENERWRLQVAQGGKGGKRS